MEKNKNTTTIIKNKFYSGDKDDKRPQHNLVVNLSENLVIPAGKHYFPLWIKENKETGERFLAGNLILKDKVNNKPDLRANGWQSEFLED